MATILTSRVNLLMGARASRIVIGGVIRGRGRQYHLCFSNSDINSTRALSGATAFATSPYTRRRPCSAKESAVPQFFVLRPSTGCCNFHSSTTLMARKRNGGKKGKQKIPKTKEKKIRDGDAATSLPLTNSIDILSETDQEESAPEFIATFASEYHAPVMPVECIDALLKQGEWGEMLQQKKERWRKKRSITKAKLRRLGHYDDEDEDANTRENVSGENTITADSLSGEINTDDRPRLFIDGTLGGGGHSQALLQQLRVGDVLIGCDVDPEALATASARLTEYLATCEYILDKNDPEHEPKCGWEEERPMFIPVQSNFRNLVSVLSKVRHPKTGQLLLGARVDSKGDESELEFPGGVNGMLLDLGVSSHQIDTGERGFAFMKDGPLDMRMSGNSQVTGTLTAADICNEFDEDAIIDILRTYGDEPRARRIASAIVTARPLYTTTALVHAINTVTPIFARQKRAGLIATSARVFQALRIVVNEEDAALKEVLEKVAPWALARSGNHYLSKNSGDDKNALVDGVLVVLSYHSMEDKMAKRVIRDGKVDMIERSARGGIMDRDIYGNDIGEDDSNRVPFEPLAKPRKATEEEIAVNSRSRSATLRVALRI